MAAVERFDIEKVAQIFQDSLRDDDDVLMDEYLKAYEEIMKYKQYYTILFCLLQKDLCTV